MNTLVPTAATMTTREIAELTGKKHFHVVRDATAMLSALGIDASSFGLVYLDAKSEERTMLALPKDLTLTLVAGYAVVLRHRIVQRWLELESAVLNPALLDAIRREVKSEVAAHVDALQMRIGGTESATAGLFLALPSLGAATPNPTVSFDHRRNQGRMTELLAATGHPVKPRRFKTALLALAMLHGNHSSYTVARDGERYMELTAQGLWFYVPRFPELLGKVQAWLTSVGDNSEAT